ncbi:30S ribosomal protein S1 [Kurthia zopfii]|uniref:30S ribosomal protein S1 homolog n=1 Tax=Kurthia zopfii TaxID=1650 RepID=A0A8B4Q9B7_9BACL|nr:30S ribosomal protein S1 [Kurthia zopfii]PWI23415.1 30S ribosomal protein S1 [Kurthia zopfii]TDR39849.1 small subunit ribosomal protein S1 [Kurthia zopfii]GEK30737.1 30S ribosomal protein S1 [Kurthia zopfii]STX09298.1 30S ribosomal protein S1 homolog [Kurthia zopfii]
MSEEMNVNELPEVQEGTIVKVTVESVEDNRVIVSIPNAKYDGIIPISELSSLHVEKASDVVSIGDEFEAMVTKVEESSVESEEKTGNYVLSKRKVDATIAWKKLEQQFEDGEVIEAEVKDVVKGGLVVDLGVRGFVPASLVEDHFVESFEDYKGKTISFKIVEMDQEKNRLILSHRAVVQDQKEQQKGEVIQTIKVGSVMEGTVQRLAAFGAFVDLGGIDGLVHISQVAYEHVEKIEDVLKEGQKVNVKVLAVDPDEGRVSLSIKETLGDPWSVVHEKAPKGTVLTGTVRRLVTFGAFVEILPGIEGLVHISQIAHKHINTPHEVLQEGQEVEVKVLEVNESDKRIALSIKALIADEGAPEEVTDYELPEQETGFSFGDILGEKLKDFNKE